MVVLTCTGTREVVAGPPFVVLVVMVMVVVVVVDVVGVRCGTISTAAAGLLVAAGVVSSWNRREPNTTKAMAFIESG